jgi:lactoylglutathione lyase
MFRKINAVVLIADDLDKLMQFYRDTLSLEVVFSDANSYALRLQDQDFALLKASAAVEEVSDKAIAKQVGVGSRVMLCANVENVDAAYETLKSKGVVFFQPPTSQPWGRRTTTFADPEGNLWELFQELPKN